MKYEKLMENAVARQVVTEADMVADVVRARGRGFSSPGEAYAAMLERMENAKEKLKDAEKTIKALWAAVKDRDDDSVTILLDQLRKNCTGLGAEMLLASGLARIATTYPFGPFLIDEKLTATSPDDAVK